MKNKLFGGRHFVLYAKGKYHRSKDPMTDMGHLVADYSAVGFADVSENDIFTVVCDIAIPLMLKSANPKLSIENLLGDLLKQAHIGNMVNTLDCVLGMLSFLSQVKVKDGKDVILKLGEPDYDILPSPG